MNRRLATDSRRPDGSLVRTLARGIGNNRLRRGRGSTRLRWNNVPPPLRPRVPVMVSIGPRFGRLDGRGRRHRDRHGVRLRCRKLSGGSGFGVRRFLAVSDGHSRDGADQCCCQKQDADCRRRASPGERPVFGVLRAYGSSLWPPPRTHNLPPNAATRLDDRRCSDGGRAFALRRYMGLWRFARWRLDRCCGDERSPVQLRRRNRPSTKRRPSPHQSDRPVIVPPPDGIAKCFEGHADLGGRTRRMRCNQAHLVRKRLADFLLASRGIEAQHFIMAGPRPYRANHTHPLQSRSPATATRVLSIGSGIQLVTATETAASSAMQRSRVRPTASKRAIHPLALHP